ncbi:uncharacterized protein LOC104433941 isoform X1 [Eucalyptus grandis]|uniref:uncharacterized protein LOC104433941 isoform X1 n=2 Tax=Eucalyptus grandis TaxID=71139 RepID=UPI00192EA329|nr:uncharacterized protein LOC104433941 isoform X1 [Eucalyptus grandis]
MASDSFFESLILFWEEWELRLLVLMSLILQIILVGLGNRRKYSAGNKIAFVLWLAYLCADSIAIISLGILSRSQGKCSDAFVDLEYVIMAFWAPFLLLHLGGPDTITAYSLEDNELWLRHSLGLIVEVAVVLYIFVRSMKPTQLNFLAIPIFVAGLIKYGERTWVLRSASSQQLRRSLLPHPDPGPNYSKFMEEYTLKEIEGYELSLNDIPPPRVAPLDHEVMLHSRLMQEGDALIIAYDFFLISKRLFADLILSFQDLQKTQPFFLGSNWEDAFKVIEMELGFMYDVLFTKATIVHHFWGGVLRSISFSSTAAALIAFCLIDLSGYPSATVIISLILLGGAIGLELYAISGLLSSDWTMLWMSRHDNLRAEMRGLISRLHSLSINKRWSNCVAQFNMLSSCLEDRRVRCCGLLNWIHKQLEDYQDDQMEPVSEYLKKSIFEQLLEKSNKARLENTVDFRLCKELCSYRGEGVLKKFMCIEKLGWSIEVEFDQSIILWHIATDLCLNGDGGGNQDPDTARREAIRVISNYMSFVLMKRPFMLPDGIGQIRLQDTRAEAEVFIQERKDIRNKSLACKKLLTVDTRISPIHVKGDRSKSVLFDACRLATSLRSLKTGNQNEWKVMFEVWIEMLCYAACHCRWNHHAQQLRRGGELLTHVWILMTHLGISQQFQISQGHARTKLIVQ